MTTSGVRTTALPPAHGRGRWPRRVLAIASPSGLTNEAPAALLGLGLEVLTYPDGAMGLIGAATESPSAVVAPTDMTGVDVLRFVDAISTWRNVPVIVGLTRSIDSQDIGFAALGRGARALIALPFTGAQLSSALHGLGFSAEDSALPLALGPIVLDPRAHRLTVGGDAVHLTPKEFLLLEHLILEHPRVVSVGELTAHLDDGHSSTMSGIRVMVSRLRRKLDAAAAGRTGTLLETVRGLGYRMTG